MYIQYGGFQFLPEEAGLAVQAEFVRSSRHFKAYQRVRYDIFGELCITGQYDITTRLNQIIAAFSLDDQDFGLYHDDGTPSTHFQSTTTNNLTGNQVLYKKFPETVQGEYTSGRKFQLGVGCLLYDPEIEVIHHYDSLRRISNAGPMYDWRYDLRWGFYPQVVAPQTMQTIVHTGTRTGISTWPLPVTPFYDPPFEQNHLREVTHHAPKRYPKGYTEYKVDWKYIYKLPTFDDISNPTLGP